MPRQHGTSPIEQIARIFGVPLELVVGPRSHSGRRRPASPDLVTDIDELLDQVSLQGSSTGYGKAWPYQGSF